MTSRELFIKELSLYDRASDGHDEFYAHLPYVKDYDLCNWRPLRMHSGNIIKARQCKVNPPVIIDSDPC